MKKTVLWLVLLCMGTSFGQVKKISVTSQEEINTLGKMEIDIFDGSFTKEQIDKFGIENAIGYLAEFVYNDKVLYSEVFKIESTIYGELITKFVKLNACPYFKVEDLPTEVSFSLMKEKGWTVKSYEGKEVISYKCSSATSLNFSLTKYAGKYMGDSKFELKRLADDKIKVNLYRLEN